MAGIPHPIIFAIGEGGGIFSISVRSISLLSSITFTIPLTCPAPTTATILLPLAFCIFCARYSSRSSIITFLSTGMALPSSSIISERTSLLLNSASFSSVSSCFSKIPAKPPVKNFSFCQKLIECHARLKVILTSLSHSSIGRLSSFAVFAASSNSVPGVTPSFSPSFFW